MGSLSVRMFNRSVGLVYVCRRPFVSSFLGSDLVSGIHFCRRISRPTESGAVPSGRSCDRPARQEPVCEYRGING